jgi:citrate synthase
MGEEHAIYEFRRKKAKHKAKKGKNVSRLPVGYESCYQLIASTATIAAAVARLRKGSLPIAPDLNLSHAANFIYMLTGRRPDPIEERVMDVALILHADHGINASTFASMVVASTLSDIYFAVGAGISALNGPLHGGANEKVLHMLEDIGNPRNVRAWYKKAIAKKEKIMGFGHRVYKAYDPRARVLGPLAKYLAQSRDNKASQSLFRTAKELEKEIAPTLGAKKKIFPNVDFYSGIVYSCLGISSENFTPIFAASRVSGWTARVMEYLENNRIFRPRAMYIGPFNKKYTPIEKRRMPGKPRKTKKK